MVPNFLFLFGQIEVPSNTTIAHTLTAQGTYWELDEGELIISSDNVFEEASASITGSTTTNPSYGCTGDDWPGFYFDWRSSTCLDVDYIAYGFYKVTNSYNNDYFYIDIRDCKYAGGEGPCSHYNPDFFIRFEDDDDLFKWRRGTSGWQLISTGELLKVWDIANNGTPPTTSEFEDFWDHALVMTNNGSNNPRIVWGPYPDKPQPESYKVYRCVTSGIPQNFSHIETKNYDEFLFIDEEFSIWPSSSLIAYYKILPYLPLKSYQYSNTVSTAVALYKDNENLKEDDFEFILAQNYPNPFNPTTQIDYTINSIGLVTIKVYDMLGNEVASLVNERKQTGNYSTTFDAANLPSGIYVYRIVSGNFQSTNKMILLK